jgi:hypothetical protein
VLVIDSEGLEDLPDQIPTPKGSYGVHRVSSEGFDTCFGRPKEHHSSLSCPKT